MPAQSRKPATEVAPAATPAVATPATAPVIENSARQEALCCQAPAEESSELLDEAVEIEAPFRDGKASRGDFVWAIARQLGGMANASRADAVAWGLAQGVFNGRDADLVSRAEAAVMLRRFLGLSQELPKDQVAYFGDIDESTWYFTDAHVARRYGLFAGADNRFLGDAPLTVDHARLVLLRAKAPALRTPEQQSPGRPPMLEPDGLTPLLEKDELSAEDIAKARDKVAKKPVDERAALYKALASKVNYRNQRDNAATYAKKDSQKWGYAHDGDVMCNVTSMAMALNQLGIGADESAVQLEDQLDEKMVEDKLGSRYELKGQKGVAEAMGASVERISTPAFGSADEAETFYNDNVLPKLEEGAAATMSIKWGPNADYYHIVRLQWVESEGLTVDDPYGKLFAKRNGTYSYEGNDGESAEEDGAKGEDRLWSWETVASINAGRYVQIVTKA